MNEIKKQKPGRPKGKKIDWSDLNQDLTLWKTRSDREIAEAKGTSPVNVYLRRQKLLKSQQDVAFEGNPETGTKPKKRKVTQ